MDYARGRYRVVCDPECRNGGIVAIDADGIPEAPYVVIRRYLQLGAYTLVPVAINQSPPICPVEIEKSVFVGVVHQ